jgi:hypothetical protein
VATTARHSLPTPDSGDAPDVPADTKDLADAIDLKLPYVNTTEPADSAGLVWHDPDTRATRINDGTNWYPVTKAEAFGTYNVSVSSGGTSIATAVSFPAGRFTAAPHMTAWSTSSRLNFGFTNVTTSGCDVITTNFTSGTSGTVPVYWKAEEKL